MNATVNRFGPALGRILIAAIFLWSGLGKIGNFGGTAGYMASKGLPMTEVLLVVTILIEVGGAAMIILGWKARLAALALLLWMVAVTPVFHNFWAVPPDQQMVQTIMFMKNLSMMGALLYVMSFGPGPYSVDKQ